jgi:hypothetical protein
LIVNGYSDGRFVKHFLIPAIHYRSEVTCRIYFLSLIKIF